MTIPHIDKIINGRAMDLVVGSSVSAIRIIPYPPNFRRMAARIIDPAIGASTWALGSHRWIPYIGIFTRKAIMHASHRISFDHDVAIVLGLLSNIMMFRVPK